MQSSRRLLSRAVISSVLAVAFVTGVVSVQAGAPALPPRQQRDVAAPVRVSIALRRMSDRGGANERNADLSDLTERFTAALRARAQEYVESRPEDRIVVGDRPDSSAPLRLSVEGDLSRAAGDAPYLCVLRAYREDGNRRLVAQWAGTARTFRDLTGNLRRDLRVNDGGLSGELAEQVVRFARTLRTDAERSRFFEADALTTFQSNLKTLKSTVPLDVVAIQNSMSATRLIPGQAYELRLRTATGAPFSADSYVVALDAEDNPLDGAWYPGVSHLTLLAPGVGSVRGVVLFRTAPGSPQPEKTGNPAYHLSGSGSALLTEALPVQLLSPTAVSPLQTWFFALTQALRGDPAGTWQAVRYTLPTAPKENSL